MGKQWEQWETLFSWTPKITADGDCSHEFKKTFVPWKKSYDQPRQHIKKQRHYVADKGPSIQSYGFSSSRVWMWELDHKESWALKNDAFELWCWRRRLRVPGTARRSNQSILKEISPEYSSEGLMKNWLIGKKPWCWETLKTEGEGDDCWFKGDPQFSNCTRNKVIKSKACNSNVS